MDLIIEIKSFRKIEIKNWKSIKDERKSSWRKKSLFIEANSRSIDVDKFWKIGNVLWR